MSQVIFNLPAPEVSVANTRSRWIDLDAGLGDLSTLAAVLGTAHLIRFQVLINPASNTRVNIRTKVLPDGSDGSEAGPNLSAAWAMFEDALTLSAPIVGTVTFPGPSNENISSQDANEPYAWTIPDEYGLGVWLHNFLAIAAADQAQAVVTFDDGIIPAPNSDASFSARAGSPIVTIAADAQATDYDASFSARVGSPTVRIAADEQAVPNSDASFSARVGAPTVRIAADTQPVANSDAAFIARAGAPTVRIAAESRIVVIPNSDAAFAVRSGSPTVRIAADFSDWLSIAVADFTDLLSAIRFTSEITNRYGTFQYQLELTDNNGVIVVVVVDVPTKISVIIGKSTEVNKPFRPFAEAVIAADPTQIAAVEYIIEGDITVALTTISRTIFYSSAHSGVDASVDLVSEQNFYNLDIRLNKDVVKNVTDGSEGVVTAFVDGNTLTAILTGGVRNNWNIDDMYEIVDGDNMIERAVRFEHVPSVAGIVRYILVVTDRAGNRSSAAVISRVYSS